jgi:diaminohydroxyphosphoribosylaminopyrimidine deaminase / 5-amino-6-(5-phosphoribosylamino)uracil reductase
VTDIEARAVPAQTAGRAEDEAFLRRAIDLAERGLGRCAPNPMVGAVVVRDGVVAGRGWHRGPGTAHAETVALAEAGDRARGATLYVTLEPCSHQGRTPACAPAVVEAGVARVVTGMRDPNPMVDGRGFELLRAAGVDVRTDVLPDECARLVEGFATHMRSGLPFVTLKLAASLDGKTAARDGSSRWITGEEARRDAHRLRARAGAVIVGAGTAAADDPALTVRLDGYEGRQPLRVLVDSSGRTPASRRLFDGEAPLLVATTERAGDAAAAWSAAGAEVLTLPAGATGVSMPALIEALGAREVQDALIEGGPELAWTSIEEGVVDRLVLYLAPKLIGGRDAPGVLGGAGVASIADALGAVVESLETVGPDVRVVASLRTGADGVHRHR